MQKTIFSVVGTIIFCLFFSHSASEAQTPIKIFDPVNVRSSANGTGYGASAVTFNSATINLSCPSTPIAAVLSSSTDGTGKVLVDNFINLTVNSLSGVPIVGPVNVCRGGTADSTPSGPVQNCFTSSYQIPAGAGNLTGQNPDTLVSTGGVSPIDISSQLQAGAQQIKIDLVDEGGFLASSTIYLNTNCTQSGVTGPSTITGNPIPQNNPTPQQLTQNFPFNSGTDQQIQSVYDLSQAQAAGSLTISPNTIPQMQDSPVSQTAFQSTLVPGTSFATSTCLIHTGELIENQPACKLFTLQCTVGTGATGSGAQCPVSSLPNEIFMDIFDGPGFTLPDITTPSGITFHQGIGLLMAAEGWTGGPCTFDPASNLQDLLCPQNLLTNFSGPGVYEATGHVTHPNSTFIPVAQVPEDLTTVTVANQQAGGWINSSSASVTFSSQPPVLTGTNLPGAAAFVPSPIRSITYGISAANNVPMPSAPSTTDTTVENAIACPTAANPTDPAATTFTTPQNLTGLSDGNYLIHYFAQDCAGTEELKFTQDSSGSWSTGYYTFPVNVDTIAPVIASGPTLSPAPGAGNAYTVGQAVTATYSCTDERSGIIRCGSSTYSPSSGVLNTGAISSPVDTSTAGPKTYTVTAIDAAGNQVSTSVQYVVTAAFDSAIKVTLSSTTVTYPQGTNVTISIAPTKGHTPTGTVQLLDGTKVLQTSSLQGNGAAYLYIQGLPVGVHQLSATYAGDAFNPGGTSTPVQLIVNPVPVNLSTSCWNLNYPYGANFQCGVYTSSNAGPPQGVVTYQYDGAAPVSLTLQNGVAQFTLVKPPAGTHVLIIGYAAQTNYAAANPSKVTFVVTPAPVTIQLTPSSWYLTGGTLTLTASIQSWSAGPPNAIGTVSFFDGSNLLGNMPVNALGVATVTVSASSLSNGSHTIAANYSGGTNYAAASSTITITVAR
ncbi:Ig-like domain repeat protein [Alloacidobacterium dinghuense]|uniref:Ig-like domain repeat protein n=1 Tax=Alloacidobacterium dinghuense TaxID=2763107 RepID=A0A7G8BKU0_9BACT|nr:Ig-like domain-containing protein [Alloacidobacterium dinghuense]QNI33160.1 Ig-like domain repeat protein [Alloacidobacterium dinghuense]